MTTENITVDWKTTGTMKNIAVYEEEKFKAMETISKIDLLTYT